MLAGASEDSEPQTGCRPRRPQLDRGGEYPVAMKAGLGYDDARDPDLANLATRHVVEPADGTAVGPSALLSIHRVYAQALVAGRPVAPLSFGDTSLGSDRTCPAPRQLRVRRARQPAFRPELRRLGLGGRMFFG